MITKKIKHLLHSDMYEDAEKISTGVCIYSENGPSPKETDEKIKKIFTSVKEKYRDICFSADYFDVGDSTSYLSSIVTTDKIAELEIGDSTLMLAPTGAGKTRVIQAILISLLARIPVVFLVNRIVCKKQFKADLLKAEGVNDISDDMLAYTNIYENLHIMTYQEFTGKSSKFHGKTFTLILDECHSIAEDSVFSDYGQKILNFIRNNLDNTIRIYLTATDDYILDDIIEIEKTDEKTHFPLNINEETSMQSIYWMATKKFTRIKQVYLMEANWKHLIFKFYNPNDIDALIDYLEAANKDGNKSLIYCNDISKGEILTSRLEDATQVYSDEAKKMELAQIAINEQFDSSNLITTKVAENGLSLHDEKISIIVAETWDLTTLQQIIGRVRVNRKKPRPLIVLVPDYSSSDFGTISSNVCNQLNKAQKAINNPDSALADYIENKPYIYYSPITKTVKYNLIAVETLKKQFNFLSNIRKMQEKNHHAFLKTVLETYGFESEILDCMFINHDNITYFKDSVRKAWLEYGKSDLGDDALKMLKNKLKEICNTSGVYPKTLDSNIQISTVNEILAFADINERLNTKRTVYEISIN